MSYLGQIIIFLAALVSIRGCTWDSSQKGIKKVTVTGWLTVFLAFSGLIVSVIITYDNNKKAQIESQRLQETLKNTTSVKKKLQDTKAELVSANLKIDNLTSEIAIYKEILETLKKQSDRQLQQVMIQWVPLEPHQRWRAPNYIFPGSIIKFYGFREGIILEYNGIRKKVPEWDGRNPTVIPIIGHSGRKMRWSIYNNSSHYNDGKIQVLSTPRSRSFDWSWVEEKLKEIEK